jgi:hypothetical protein
MDDLKQRLRAATEGVMPGPWRLEDTGGDEFNIWSGDKMVMFFNYYNPGAFWGDEGWSFVCAARTLIPEAAAALDAKDAEIAAAYERGARAMAEEMGGSASPIDIHEALERALAGKE